MQEKEYDDWDDELDYRFLETSGKALLRRKFKKDGQYLDYYISYPDRALICAKGITAFLFGNVFFLSSFRSTHSDNTNNNIDLSAYFNKYYSICKTHYLNSEKHRPNSPGVDLNKKFLLSHIKEERNNYRFCDEYFNNTNNDKLQNKLRKEYARSYIKWIISKRPLSLINKFEIAVLVLFCVSILFTILLNFVFISENWNYAQIINRLIDNSKSETTKAIGRNISMGYFALFSASVIRIWRIIKSHKLK